MTRLAPLLLTLAAGSAACAPQSRSRGFPRPELQEPGSHAVETPGVLQLAGFSTAVKAGLTVYLSGQVPLDSTGRLVGPGDLSAQADQTVANVARVIRAAHGVPADLVHLTAYVVGYDTSAVAVLRRAISPYVDSTTPPAVTIVGVTRLPEPGMLIAVDGIAVLRGMYPDRARDRGP
jgi:enamine deaminase RidA (YjgF/YER057c/UK114 family)